MCEECSTRLGAGLCPGEVRDEKWGPHLPSAHGHPDDFHNICFTLPCTRELSGPGCANPGHTAPAHTGHKHPWGCRRHRLLKWQWLYVQMLQPAWERHKMPKYWKTAWWFSLPWFLSRVTAGVQTRSRKWHVHPSHPDPLQDTAVMEKSNLTEGAIILPLCLYMTFAKVIFTSIGDARIFSSYDFRSSYARWRRMKKRKVHISTHTDAKQTPLLKSCKDTYRSTWSSGPSSEDVQVDFPNCQSTKGSNY